MLKIVFTGFVLAFVLFACGDKGKGIKATYHELSRDSAIAMIQHYLDTGAVTHNVNTVIKSIRLNSAQLKKLIAESDSVNLFTGANVVTHQPVVIIQTVKRNSPVAYRYYQVEAAAICPPPYNCDANFEVGE